MAHSRPSFFHSFSSMALCFLLLAGCENMRECYMFCHDGTDVQLSYVNSRDECQQLAEDKVHLFLDPGPGGNDPKRINSALLALFAKCMHIKDWGVTAPKQEAGRGVPASQANAANSNRAGVGLAPGFSGGSSQPSLPQPQNYSFPAPVPYPGGQRY